MSNEEAGYGTTRRPPRQGVGGSPVGSWITIALAVLAVLIGFLILRNITDDDASTDPGVSIPVEPPTSSLPLPDVTVAPAATTTIPVEPRVVDGAKVIVANANSVGGSAGDMTDELEAAGYGMVDPTNASGPNVTESVVYFDAGNPASQAVANSVARDLGGLDVLQVETPAPTVDGDLGDADVMLLLGDDQAGKTIAELSGAAAGPSEAPADPAATVASTPTTEV